MKASVSYALFVLAFLSTGAAYRTQNFLVEAPTPQIAAQVGQYAEHYRKEKAIEWIGQEMTPWMEPCSIKVIIKLNDAGGATSFAFDNGRVLGQDMVVEGPMDRILASVLPHEITHTVFAYYFRTPVPRWADEGGCVLSEDELEKYRHDQLVREILSTPGRRIPLRRLFNMSKYPGDVMVLYAEGFSVSQYLVSIGGRQNFLGFVATGMRQGWDAAAKAYYRFKNIEDLEENWLRFLRDNRQGNPTGILANQPIPRGNAPILSMAVTRQTLPPGQPMLEGPRPVYRGSSPGNEPKEIANPSIRPGNTFGTPQPGAGANGWNPPIQLGGPISAVTDSR